LHLLRDDPVNKKRRDYAVGELDRDRELEQGNIRERAFVQKQIRRDPQREPDRGKEKRSD